jgi:hypothetical protein
MAMFTTVQLNAGSELVAPVELPAFQPMPDVIVWGDRFFQKRPGKPNDALIEAHYDEIFAYVVPILEG